MDGVSNEDMVANSTAHRVYFKEGDVDKEEGDVDKEAYTPKIGMEFDSIDAAEKFYYRYSEKLGFSVRICRTKKVCDIVTHREYCCSRQGFRALNETVVNPRIQTRCGCEAFISLKRLITGKYLVYKFQPKHNHDLVSPKQVHLLRSCRRKVIAQKADVDKASTLGMDSQMAIGSNPIYLKSCLQTKRKTMTKMGDVASALEYFQMMQLNNPSSFYAVQLDEDELITNMFWAYPKMMIDYCYFGDVVCFDTTYKWNNNDRPLALFVGVNHHKHLVVFGAAFLFDETISTFEWLFETFDKAMCGNKPKTILTDHSAVLASAVSSILPESHHRLCVWHMYGNAARNLNDLFDKNTDFMADFRRCLFDYDGVKEFEYAWNEMVHMYNLQGNQWLEERFETREQWAAAYGREIFCADITATQLTDSLNSEVKRLLDNEAELLPFFEAFERILEERGYKELASDLKMSQGIPYMHFQWNLLRHATSVYTPAALAMLEKESLEMSDLEISLSHVNGTAYQYRVSHRNKDQVYIVSFNDVDCTLSCTCRLFESIGIICRHSLMVLQGRNINNIPEHYILKRWSRKAREVVVTDVCGFPVDSHPQEQISARSRNLCSMLVQLANKASISDATSKMVADFTFKMIQEIDGNLGNVLAESQKPICTADKSLKAMKI